MDKEITYKGWVDLLTNTNNAGPKSWMKRQVQKKWKRKFIILYNLAGNSENPRLGSYSKEEDNLLHLGNPKKNLLLHPLFKINKCYDFKGKRYVLVVCNNNNEEWYVSDDSVDVVDKWATHIQMELKLNRSISTCIYIVDCAESEETKRLGAAQQKCILYFNKCGVTLAHASSRSILALWPLRTIRNYECGKRNEFSIEAGRRAPMGEGKYVFFTLPGKNQEMFGIIDGFVVSALHEKVESPRENAYEINEEMQAYQRLYESAIGFSDTTGARRARTLAPQTKVENNQTYNYILEQDNASSSHDINDHSSSRVLQNEEHNSPDNLYGNTDFNGRPDGSTASDSYNTLERNPDIRQSMISNYDNINENNVHGGGGNQTTYNSLNRKCDTRSKREVKDVPMREYAEIEPCTSEEEQPLILFQPGIIPDRNNMQQNDSNDGSKCTLNNPSTVPMVNNFSLSSAEISRLNYDQLEHNSRQSRTSSDNNDQNNMHVAENVMTYDLLDKTDGRKKTNEKYTPTNEYAEIEEQCISDMESRQKSGEDQNSFPQFRPDIGSRGMVETPTNEYAEIEEPCTSDVESQGKSGEVQNNFPQFRPETHKFKDFCNKPGNNSDSGTLNKSGVNNSNRHPSSYVPRENNISLGGNGISGMNYDTLMHNTRSSKTLSSNYDNIDENNIHGGGILTTYDLLGKSDGENKTREKSIPTNEYAEIEEPSDSECKENIEAEKYDIPRFNPNTCQSIPENHEFKNSANKLVSDSGSLTLNNKSYDTLEHDPRSSQTLSSNNHNINENNIRDDGIVMTYDSLGKTAVTCKETELYDVPQFHVGNDQQVNFRSTVPGDHEIRDSSSSASDWYDNPSVLQSREDSNVSLRSQGKEGKHNSLLQNHSMQEIADHFIYQMPTSLPASDLAQNESTDGR